MPQIPHMEAKSHPKMRGKPCVAAAGYELRACPAVFLHTNAAMRATGLGRLPTGRKRPGRRTIHVLQVTSWWPCLPIRELPDRESAATMIRPRESVRVEYARCDRTNSSRHIRGYCLWQPEIFWDPRALRESACSRPLRAILCESWDP